MSSGDLATWFGVVVTALGVLFAIFQQQLMNWWHGPRLELAFHRGHDCVAHVHLGLADAYQFRIAVKNIGKLPAQDVEVYLQRVRRRHGDGAWQPITILPGPLKWSDQEADGGRTTLPGVPGRGAVRFCDLFLLAENTLKATAHWGGQVRTAGPLVVISKVVQPVSCDYVLPLGCYEFILEVSASNAPTVRAVIQVEMPEDANALFAQLADSVSLAIAAPPK